MTLIFFWVRLWLCGPSALKPSKNSRGLSSCNPPPLSHFTLGTAQARFGDSEPAKESFQKAIQLDPRFAQAHVSLAMILAQQKELTAAREHLLQAIQIDEKSPSAAHSHYLLAQILTEQDDVP